MIIVRKHLRKNRLVRKHKRRLKKGNVAKRDIPNVPGLYVLKDRKNKPIYIGSSKKLRHRLQSYYQKDDYKTHPTKKRLRNRAVYFSCRQMPIYQARKIEKASKKPLKFNFK